MVGGDVCTRHFAQVALFLIGQSVSQSPADVCAGRGYCVTDLAGSAPATQPWLDFWNGSQGAGVGQAGLHFSRGRRLHVGTESVKEEE